jgi:hypothetical protein
MTNTDDGPPRGTPIWRMYCPRCKRFGEIAAVKGWGTDQKPLPKEAIALLMCPDCGGEIEIIGRSDQ